MSMKLRDIAALLNAEIAGNETVEIRRVAKIEEAREGDISFIANPKYTRFLATTHASAVIVGKKMNMTEAHPPALLRVDDPYASFLKVLATFNPPRDPLPPGIHPTAVVAPSARLGPDVRIGACAVIGENCTIGDKTMIGHGTVIGEGVRIGSASLLYAHVTVPGW